MLLKLPFIRKILFIMVASAFILFINGAFPAFSQIYSQEDQLNVNIYETINPTIVSIDADITDGVSSGTGCIIDSRGLILTSSHVIEGAKKINVTLSNNKSYPAKLISVVGENSDLAILKINSDSQLPVIRLGDSSKIRVGQKVLAIGNPFGFSGTLTEGIISRIDYKRNKIQTDAAINPGCSGGPILNMGGEVIGISQSIYNPDDNKSNIGIGFAVPVNAAKRFIAKVKNEVNASLTSDNKSYGTTY